MTSKHKPPLPFPANRADRSVDDSKIAAVVAVVSEAVTRLMADDVVGIPTETVYGLGARIGSESGLRKIFATKERPFFDPLIVHVSSFKQAQSLVSEWSPLADFLARTFWPGPLTLVLPKSEKVNPLITSGLETVGIRYPAHPLALDIINQLGEPIAAPSANKFGKTSPSSAEHVQKEFAEVFVVDGGACEIGLESTVCSVDGANGLIQILRPGAITLENITAALKKWSGETRVEINESVASPGHLKHHYMPAIPVFIMNHAGPPSEAELVKVCAELNFEGASFRIEKPIELVLNSAAELAARELYSNLRKLSESGADAIYVFRSVSQVGGFWDAIWDRLSRAASVSL